MLDATERVKELTVRQYPNTSKLRHTIVSYGKPFSKVFGPTISPTHPEPSLQISARALSLRQWLCEALFGSAAAAPSLAFITAVVVISLPHPYIRYNTGAT